MKNPFPIPAWCYSCRHFIQDRSLVQSLCRRCFEELPWAVELCGKCGLDHFTESCDEKWAKNLRRFWAVFRYEDPIRSWISQLKYGRNLLTGRILRDLIAVWISINPDPRQIEIVAPVPVSTGRLHLRGFNQTGFLAKPFQPRVYPRLLRKIKSTPQQAGLSKKERLGNLRESFAVSSGIVGKSLLLFDDVCSTGNTLEILSRKILDNGAESVSVCVLSRNLG